MSTPSVQRSDRLVRSRELHQATVGDEIVLLDAEAGSYFGLDAMGVVVWTALAEPTLVGDLVRDLAAQFNVSEETVERDVLPFLNQLREHGLVSEA